MGAKRRTKATPASGRRTGRTKVGPVARVWQIAEAMPGAARKDVVAACVAKGINVFTARTQYQRWRQARTA